MQGVAGTWKELTESVNSMASNRTLAGVKIAARDEGGGRGDWSKKITVDVKGGVRSS